jgi:hypothetical protein
MHVGDVVGRGEWLETLTALPFVTLLRAPASTGKRTVAQYIARREGVAATDQVMYPTLQYLDDRGRPVNQSDDRAEIAKVFEPELTISDVRELIKWARSSPMSSPFKLAIVRLDNVRPDGSSWLASERTLAAMLKLLEEPPVTTRFILLATKPTMPMIRSRTQELTAGLLSRDHVAEILFAVTDMSLQESQEAAVLGGGQVAFAVGARSALEGSVQAVVDVLTSLQQRDQIALTEKARIWTDADTQMLLRWAHERITGDWALFAGSGAPEVSVSAAERVLRAVSSVAGARPRIVLGAVAALAGK